jgi:ATP/maltotriose-dependent transcriptional regulator MalT
MSTRPAPTALRFVSAGIARQEHLLLDMLDNWAAGLQLLKRSLVDRPLRSRAPQPEHFELLVTALLRIKPLLRSEHQDAMQALLQAHAAEPGSMPPARPAPRRAPAKLLSGREIEVLQLLGRGFSTKGTARELALSPGTVKWHIRNIYDKLDAPSRERALAKARELRLLA